MMTTIKHSVKQNFGAGSSVCISGYPLSGYPDICVNFMAAKNPDILMWKSGCCGCAKMCKLCLWYCGGTSNYSKSNSHASNEWMVTLVNQTRSKECNSWGKSIYMHWMTEYVMVIVQCCAVLTCRVALRLTQVVDECNASSVEWLLSRVLRFSPRSRTSWWVTPLTLSS